jgi:hypothetical protein
MPDGPLLSMTRRRICGPAASVTAVFVSVRHDCQPPVSGTVIGPVLSTPPDSMWNLPPAPPEATRIEIV